MDVLKLDDEIAIKVEIGDKTFTVADPWELDEVFSDMWQKASDENERQQRAEKEQAEKGEPVTRLCRVTEHDVWESIKKYVNTVYKVEISRGHANALYLLIKKAVAAKKQNWLASFKLSAS